jgi:hypothetical protein
MATYGFLPHRIFFLFSGGALFGEYRPSAPAQVVCCYAIDEWGWGDIP